jgi:hypothetical protein
MNLIPVQSQAFCAYGYRRGVLTVVFHSSKVYRYGWVPRRVFKTLQAAPPKGTISLQRSAHTIAASWPPKRCRCLTVRKIKADP